MLSLNTRTLCLGVLLGAFATASAQDVPRNVVIDAAAQEPRIERRDSAHVLVLSPRMWAAFRDSFPNGRPLQPHEFTDVPWHRNEALFAVVGDLDGDGRRDAMFLSRLGVRPREHPSRAPYVAKVAILTRSAAAGPVARGVGTAGAYRDTTQSTSTYLRGYAAAEWQDNQRRPIGRLPFAVRAWTGGNTQSTLLYFRDGSFHQSFDAGVLPAGTTALGAAAGPLNPDSLAMVDDPPQPVRYARPLDVAALPQAVRAELTRRDCRIPYNGKELEILSGAFYSAGPKNDWAVRCSRGSGEDATSVLLVFGAGRAAVDTVGRGVGDSPAYAGSSEFPRGEPRLYSGFHAIDAAHMTERVRDASELPADRRTGAVYDAIASGDVEGAGTIYYWSGTSFVAIGGFH